MDAPYVEASPVFLPLLVQSPPSAWAKSNFTPLNVILNTCTKYPACHTGFMKHGQKWCPTWTAGISTGYLEGVSTLGKIVLYRPQVQFRPTLFSPQLVGFHISTCVH